MALGTWLILKQKLSAAFWRGMIVALMGALLLAAWMHRFELEAKGGESIQLLTDVKPISAGSLITDAMLATRSVPRAYVEDRAILAWDWMRNPDRREP